MYRKMRNCRRFGRRCAVGRPVPAATVLAVPVLALAGTAPAAASPTVPRWIRIAAGGDFTCGIREGNTLWCWGAPDFGDLGTGAVSQKLRPQQIGKPTSGWVSVTAGSDHACALRRDTTLWCWGDNGEGEAGIGSPADNVTRPHQVTTPAADGWVSAAAGGGHTCATRADFTLWCWGLNFDGQLGTGTTASENLPHQVTTPAADGWASVAAGAGHTCAIRGDGTLWCWGFGPDGELGIGGTTDQGLPQQVTTPAADGWASVAAGAGHTCAVRADATLWCWGSGFFGQLGTGGTVGQPLPQQVTTPAADGWTSVAAGGFFTCALRTHALWCWGDNDDGELGIGGTASQPVPRRVPVPSRNGWGLIAPGDFHACAIRAGHALWCWGYNAAGELGLDSTTEQHRAQQVTA